MKRPTTLLHRILLDEGLQISCTIERDVLEIERRYQNEGMGFLTITLPTLSEALEQGLQLGRITPDMFAGFKPWKRGGRLPGLLRGFFMRVFDIDGLLLEHPCIASIRAIRQVTRLFKKVELPCSPARRKRAFERYVSNDRQVYAIGDWCAIDLGLWTRVNSYLWSDLEDLSGELYCFPGKFGSGATAERRKLNERLSVCEWPTRAEESFPSSYHAVAYPDPARLAEIKFLDMCDERPVRVVQVPKTLKTPRTISVEPSYMMLMQQSIAQPLMRYLEGKRFPYNSIRFTDQSVNRDLAREGSIDGSLATIDLSDASDMVSYDLIKSMFGSVCPAFFKLIDDCRSTRALMPDRTEVKLRKFASMGSALCFPLESMAFFSIACYSMLRQEGSVPSRKRLRELTAKLAIYGDDIIIPTQMVAGLMEDLEAFGLKVNREKSFVAGFFRESCGGDYYKGHDVTPTYCRRWNFSGDTSDASTLISWVSLSNQIYLKGLWHAADYIRSYLESKFKHKIPFSTSRIGCVHFASVVFSDKLNWDRHSNSYCVRGLVPEPREQDDELHEIHGALLYTFQLRDHSRNLARVNRLWSNSLSSWSSVEDYMALEPAIRAGRDLGLLLPDGQDRRDHGRNGEIPVGRVSRRDDMSYTCCSADPKAGSLDYLFPEMGFGSSTTSMVPYSTKLKSRWVLSKDSVWRV